MNKTPNITKFQAILIVLLTVTGFVWLTDGDTTRSNLAYYMPLVKRFLDPQFLLNDYYINSNSGFSVRAYFTALVGFTSYTLGSSNLALSLLYGCFLSGVGIIIYQICLLLFEDRRFALWCTVLVMFIDLSGINPGAMVLNLKILTPNLIAQFGLLFAALSLLQGRLILVGVGCGFAAIFQPIEGALGYLLCSAVIIEGLIKEKKWQNFKLMLGSIISFLLIASINFIPLFNLQSITAVSNQSEKISSIIAIFRHPMHSDYTTWPLLTILTAIQFWILVYKMSLDIKFKIKVPRLRLCISILVALLILGIISIHIYPISFVAKAQFFRALVTPSVLGMIILLRWLWVFTEETITFTFLRLIPVALLFERYGAYLGIAAIFVIYLISHLYRESKKIRSDFYDSLFRYFNKYSGNISTILILLFAGYYFNQIALGIALISLVAISLALKFSRVIFTCICILLAMSFYIPMVNNCEVSPNSIKFIQENSTNSDLFIVPPSWVRFRLCTERAVAVDLSPSFTDIGILDWFTRLQLLMPGLSQHRTYASSELHKLYCNGVNKNPFELLTQFEAKYIVAPKGCFAPEILTKGRVVQNEEVVLFTAK